MDLEGEWRLRRRARYFFELELEKEGVALEELELEEEEVLEPLATPNPSSFNNQPVKNLTTLIIKFLKNN